VNRGGGGGGGGGGPVGMVVGFQTCCTEKINIQTCTHVHKLETRITSQLSSSMKDEMAPVGGLLAQILSFCFFFQQSPTKIGLLCRPYATSTELCILSSS